MSKWTVYRRGYNAYNNPARDGGDETVAVAIVEADSAEEACVLASRRVSVFNNQSLCAELKANVDAREADLDRRVELI